MTKKNSITLIVIVLIIIVAIVAIVIKNNKAGNMPTKTDIELDQATTLDTTNAIKGNLDKIQVDSTDDEFKDIDTELNNL